MPSYTLLCGKPSPSRSTGIGGGVGEGQPITASDVRRTQHAPSVPRCTAALTGSRSSRPHHLQTWPQYTMLRFSVAFWPDPWPSVVNPQP